MVGAIPQIVVNEINKTKKNPKSGARCYMWQLKTKKHRDNRGFS